MCPKLLGPSSQVQQLFFAQQHITNAGLPSRIRRQEWTIWKFIHEPSLLHPGETSSCVTRSAAWSYLELGPKSPLPVTAGLTQCPRLLPSCWELRSEFTETLNQLISSEYRSEEENFLNNLTRRGPWNTIHTTQVSGLLHVLSLWKQKWWMTEGNAELEKILLCRQLRLESTTKYHSLAG